MKYICAFLLLTGCGIDAREPLTPAAPPEAPKKVEAPAEIMASPEIRPAQPLGTQKMNLDDLVSPTFSLVRADRVAEVAAHLREATDLNRDGQLPIFEARSYEMARLLWDVTAIRARFQPERRSSDWRDSRGRLALHVWAAEGRARPVQYALERMCGRVTDGLLTNAVNTADLDGLTPALAAVRTGDLVTVDLFVGCDSVDWSLADARGRTALHEAVARGDAAILQTLLVRRTREMAVLVDARDEAARTPWTMALEKQSADVIAALRALRR